LVYLLFKNVFIFQLLRLMSPETHYILLYLCILLQLVLEFIFQFCLLSTMQQYKLTPFLNSSLQYIHTAHLIDNRNTKKDNTCGIDGGTTFTSIKNIVNMKTLIVQAQKVQHFPQISVHLRMAE
jgi:hypothetical protein